MSLRAFKNLETGEITHAFQSEFNSVGHEMLPPDFTVVRCTQYFETDEPYVDCMLTQDQQDEEAQREAIALHEMKAYQAAIIQNN